MRRAWLRNLFAVLVYIAVLECPGARAESVDVRTFRLNGTYAATVTISPGGNVITKSGENSKVSLFDGYGHREIPIPVESNFRVYQSRSGQLWTVTPEGVLLFHTGKWTMHPIPQIRNELVNNPIRPLRQIALLPAEVNHLIILLPDQLLDYDATTRRIGVLKESKNTKIGEFSEISEALDGTIWISGRLGIANINSQPRRITADSKWQEYPLPNTNLVSYLQRLNESPKGIITTVANPPNGQRYVVEWNRGAWNMIPVEGEKIRQAWRGWDDRLWGFSYNSVFEIMTNGAVRREPVVGAQYDMAVETNGVFWLASSEGLVRYAPDLWRTPPMLEPFEGAIHSVLFDDDEIDSTWIWTSQGLVHKVDENVRVYSWPEELELAASSAGDLYHLPHGALLIHTPKISYSFNRENGQFHRVPNPDTNPFVVLGQFRDGTVCVWIRNRETKAMRDIRRFDGVQFTPLQFNDLNWKVDEVTFFRETSNGDWWFAGNSSLLHLRGGTHAPEVISSPSTLPSDRVSALEDVGEGRVWCGMSSGVVFELRGGKWQRILSARERVTGILKNSGGTWISTLDGIYRYYLESWFLYGPGDGLEGAAIYQVKADVMDQTWAATSRGVYRFHSDADTEPPESLPPIVQEQNPSTVEPALVTFRGRDKWDYTFANDLLFSYRLDEGVWSPFSNVTARAFQNLSSGRHVIEVLAMDKNGNKSLLPAKIEFSMVIPWFKDPRLVSVAMSALTIVSILAAYAAFKNVQLKRSYAEVEKIVEQRTGELKKANQELLHSQKMRAIGTMAAGIAHDFNNILSIIKGSAQIIESNPGDKDKIRIRVNRIQTVVEQGSSIVKALLGLGKIEDQAMTHCQLAEVLRDTKRLLGDRFPPAIHIELELEENLPPVVCSREVIQQMLLNFILNAVDAMENSGTVTIQLQEWGRLSRNLVLDPAPSSKYQVITVIDQGCGIRAETLARIFEPFFTTKSFSSRRGTGLGLSMVYELAKGMRYGLGVSSELGIGSRFSLWLPVDSVEEVDSKKLGKTQPTEGT